MNNTATEFDVLIGKIAGAIYSDVCHQFPHPPLMLVPALTFKVRKTMEQVTSLALLTKEQRAQLAKDLQISIIPMLFSYEIEPEIIDKIAPTIESAALRALVDAVQ